MAYNDSYYKEITIENYRSIEKIEMKDLSNINLLFGNNNCGKTSILEAIFAHACQFNVGYFFNIILPKRTQGLFFGFYDLGESIVNLFRKGSYTFENMKFSITSKNKANEETNTIYNFTPSNNLDEINPNTYEEFTIIKDTSYKHEATKNNQPEYLGELTISNRKESKKFPIYQNLQFPRIQQSRDASYIDILEHRKPPSAITIYSALKRTNTLQELIQEMQKVFPEINDIETIQFKNNASNIYIDSKGEKIPFSIFGDGMRRWYYLIGNMVANKNSVQLIEEIDSTFHPESIPMLSKTLVDYSVRYNNQIVMTSHNQEFLKIMLDTFKNDEGILRDKIRVYTLKKIKNETKLLSLNGEEARKNIEDYGLELR